LGGVERGDTWLRLGAMARLQTLVEDLKDVASGLLSETAHRMAPLTVRNSATVGGTLASGAIHEPLSVALGALRVRVELFGRPGEPPVWPDLASEIRLTGLPAGQLITGVVLTLPEGTLGGGYAQVGRTPGDKPIVCAAAVAYPAGDGSIETYTAVGGLLHDLIVVGEVIAASGAASGVESAVGKVLREHAPESAYISDYLGTPEYRRAVAPVMARRALMRALATIGVPVS
jgi:carbon-monoxide dehydrogenase medium subunit